MKHIYVIVVLLALAVVALAGNVYDRDTITLGTSTGTARWTNDYAYSALELKRLWMFTSTGCSTVAPQVVTVTRITSDGLYTQSVGSVTLNTNGTYTSTAASSLTVVYLKAGDLLAFAGSTATGGTGMIEFEVQQH